MRAWITMLAVCVLIGCEWNPKPAAKRQGPASSNQAAEVNDDDLPKDTEQVKADGTKEIDKTSNAPLPKDKWNLDYADKTWGLKFKTLKYVEQVIPPPGKLGTNPSSFHYKLLIECTKDIGSNDEVAKLKMILQGQQTPGIEWVALDDDNVVVSRFTNGASVVSDLTGVKGDAFWLMVAADFPGKDKAKRIELRGQKR